VNQQLVCFRVLKMFFFFYFKLLFFNIFNFKNHYHHVPNELQIKYNYVVFQTTWWMKLSSEQVLIRWLTGWTVGINNQDQKSTNGKFPFIFFENYEWSLSFKDQVFPSSVKNIPGHPANKIVSAERLREGDHVRRRHSSWSSCWREKVMA
jgi:hypothetical protein